MTFNLQALIAPLDAAKDAEIAAQKAIIDRLLPGFLGIPTGKAIFDWDKLGWRGHPLDLSGYTETFREDFNTMSVTDETGSGPVYAPVHTDFGNVKFRKPSENTGTYTIVDGKLRIRMDVYQWNATVNGVAKQWNSYAAYPGDPVPGNNPVSPFQAGWIFDGFWTALKPVVSKKWQSGHISTLTRGGVGFHQLMGAFEYRYSLPSGGGTNGAPGYWGGGWLLSANEFIASIGGQMIENDLQENYGGDAKGLHSSLHVKAKRVPLPGDHLQSGQREFLSNYTNLFTATATGTTTPLLFPGTTWNPMTGEQRTVTAIYDEEWYTVYYEGLSICRFPVIEQMRTPMYMNFSSIMQNGMASVVSSAPQDAYIDYIRALQKP